MIETVNTYRVGVSFSRVLEPGSVCVIGVWGRFLHVGEIIEDVLIWIIFYWIVEKLVFCLLKFRLRIVIKYDANTGRSFNPKIFDYSSSLKY